MPYRYTKDHEWVDGEGAELRVGISDYAQQELGDVVYVQLPEVGIRIKQGETFMTVESVKAVSDIYAPIDGTIAAVNSVLDEKPELINSSPENEAWLVLLKPDDSTQLASLMSAGAYAEYVRTLAG